MAFRFYGGSAPSAVAPWKCPSCQQENTSPLERGCTHCGVGADATHVGQDPVRVTRPQAEATTVGDLVITGPDGQAFERWLARQPRMDTATQMVAKRAFLAGMDWAWKRDEIDHPDPRDSPVRGAIEGEAALDLSEQPPAPLEGATLYISDYGDDGVHQIDDRSKDTIVAALLFYKDNQLGYGAIPGQLSAQEVTELVKRLVPGVLDGTS